jgi:hypothetical protein
MLIDLSVLGNEKGAVLKLFEFLKVVVRMSELFLSRTLHCFAR